MATTRGSMQKSKLVSSNETVSTPISAAQDGSTYLYALPENLLNFVEASHCSPANKDQIVHLLQKDAALLAAFIDHLTASRCIPKEAPPTENWLNTLVGSTSENDLQTLAIACSQPYIRHSTPAELLLIVRSLQRDALYLAELMEALARATARSDAHEARLTGLCHNLGKQLLLQKSASVFIQNAIPTLVNNESRQREVDVYAIDHIDIATALLSRWPVDSFLADAINYQLAEIDHDSSAPHLITLLRACLCLSQTDSLNLANNLNPTNNDDALLHHLALADIDLNGTRASTLLSPWRKTVKREIWMQQDDDTFCAIQRKMVVDLQKLCAHYGVICQRKLSLSTCRSKEELIAAGNKVLSYYGASNTVFFFLDERQKILNGYPAVGQQQRIAQLQSKLEPGASLIAQTLLNLEPLDTFTTERFALGVLDKQLITIGGSNGYFCLPVAYQDELIGVVVIAADDSKDMHRLKESGVISLVSYIAEKLHLLSAEKLETGRSEQHADIINEISHEISTPLSTIRNHLHLLKRDANDQTRESIKSIEDESSRISDILKAYRQRTTNTLSFQEEVDINQIIRESINRIVNQERFSGQIETNLDNSSAPIKSNPIALQQVCLNLIGNAVDAIGDSGYVSISTSFGWIEGQSRHMEIVISDNGPGIPSDIQKTLFSKTETTKGTQHSGIGLSIVKKLISELSGSISCHSDLKGTQFRILIPEQVTTTSQSNNTTITP